MNDTALRPTRMEVRLDLIRKNYQCVQQLIGTDCQVIAVVKANAYSLGLVPVAGALRQAGCGFFAVATPEEALELRNSDPVSKILLLGAINRHCVRLLVENGITLTCSDAEQAEFLDRLCSGLGKKGVLHVKIDTGLGRTGFLADTAVDFIGRIDRLENVFLEGIYTHFATADEENPEYTRWQFRRFMNICEKLERKGVSIPLRHVCNSPAIVNFPEMALDAVRPGNLLYGLLSGYESRNTGTAPCVEVKTEIVSVRTLPAHSPVGYGLNYVSRGEDRFGILPIGFYDGFARFIKKPEVLVCGKRLPVVGTICMDQIVIDLHKCPEAKVGDEAVIIGRQGSETISVRNFADKLDTIATQALALFGARVPRVYVGARP